ncbi:MAG UNVERIFIED_CONTAM: hypothetical protein LVR29_14530 [Microcystis novacekii LVE1205-3]|jgi:type I restriction enzyme M protein
MGNCSHEQIFYLLSAILDFLKPGERMAIVLPQGRFNNSSDKNIRDFIAERCRILAVVGFTW